LTVKDFNDSDCFAPIPGGLRAAAVALTLLFVSACGGGASGVTGAAGTPGTGTPPDAGANPPSVSLSASPQSVSANGSSTLTWSASGASSCSASGGWSGSKATSGSQSTGALASTASFTLSCTGSGGTATRTVTVTVVSATSPTLTFSANPSSVSNNGSTTLSWSGTNVSSCSASGAWSGTRSTSGSETVSGLTTTSAYTLSCTGSNGSITRSVTVNVGAPPVGAKIVGLQMQDRSGSAGGNIPVTFGQVFARGHVPAGATLVARTAGSGSVSVPLQVDAKATHADGSLRHAVITARIPSLAANGTQEIELVSQSGSSPSGSVALNSLLATSFDAVISLNVGGVVYQSSARQLLQAGPVSTWISGPLVTEWIVAAPLRTAVGTPHPHLHARFNVRAYAGFDSVRVDTIVENSWALAANPQNYTYDATVTIDGKGAVLSQSGVTHYRQARWRRGFWWGNEPHVHVRHDRRYLENTGAVPTYDPTVTVSNSVLSSVESEWNANNRLMGRGHIASYMPQTGGRRDIGPLPSWAAQYIISQDHRAKTATIGNSEQAGSFGIHYRDQATDLPLSLDTYPNLYMQGDPWFLTACGGSCTTPYTPDDAHQPSLAYVPYLVTGDHYHLEELHFWANWNMYANSNRNGSQGLLTGTWVQIRATAWGLRTLGQAAYATPDAHPMKAYFTAKLNNNISWFNVNYGNNPPTPLGYVYNPLGGNLDNTFATWMDDFLTWSVGHLVNLGFTNVRPFFDYKARFPVGRMTDPGYCWILGGTYWTPSRNSSGSLYTSWSTYREAVIRDWRNAIVGGRSLTTTQENELINAACNSTTMANILGLQVGEMIGYAWNYQGYPSNLQPALAVAAELGATNASEAWNVFANRSVKPSGSYSYDVEPQWAVVPRQ
jgi:hypothetical protein